MNNKLETLHTKQAVELVRAFNRISDSAGRQQLLAWVKHLAKQSSARKTSAHARLTNQALDASCLEHRCAPPRFTLRLVQEIG